MTPEQRLYSPDTRPMTQTAIDRFLAAGVPPLSLVMPDMVTPAVVYPHDENPDRFSFREDLREPAEGVSAFLIAVRDESGAIVDLAAWRPREGWLATWRGVGWALGAHEYPSPLDALHDGGAVRVFRSPMDWLRADRRGLVLLDHVTARWRFARDGMPIIADDLVHAKRLKQVLAVKPVPIILPNITERLAA